MRVLMLTSHLPFPPYSGGRRREFELLRRVCTRYGVDVKLCVVTKTLREDVEYADALRAYCSEVALFDAVRNDGSKRHRASLPFPTSTSPQEPADYVRAVTEAGAVDLLHVERFFLLRHVDRTVPVPTLLVEQNVEYELHAQRTRYARRMLEKLWHYQRYVLTRRAEIRAWRESTLCAALTRDDRQHIKAALGGRDVPLIPDGYDHVTDLRGGVGPQRVDLALDLPTSDFVLFVGNFEYQPNVDAAHFLTSEIAPKVVARRPDATFVLAGNGPPLDVQQLGKLAHVTVTGRVPRLEPYLASAAVVVCPLRIGGGVKLKLLESLHHGKAVVTTSIGAQGLDARGRQAVRIADNADALADELTTLLTHQEERRALEMRAARFVRSLPTWDDAADDLHESYRRVLAGA